MRSWIGFVVVGCLGSVGLVGCAGAAGNGAEEAEGPALVMLDAVARAAGFALVTSAGKVAPVAPVELEGEVTLVGPGQRIPLTGAAGELLVVTGKRGALVPHTLATEVDADAVRVDGAERSVRALASTLHASMTGAGPWELRAPGLVAGLARQGAPEGVTSIESVAVEATEQMARAVAAVADEVAPFSANDPRFASFGPLGRRSLTCSDPTLGTWVSVPKYSATYEDWHVFTLHVEPGASPGQLAGTLSAHVWSGGAEDTAPASCEGSAQDYHVSMETAGVRAEDGRVRFDAGPWRLDPTSCTGAEWGYNPDHFTGLVEGGALRSVNNDGGRSVNDPTAFERISCE